MPRTAKLKQLNVVLPDLSHLQLRTLCRQYGISQGRLIALAIDRLSQGSQQKTADEVP